MARLRDAEVVWLSRPKTSWGSEPKTTRAKLQAGHGEHASRGRTGAGKEARLLGGLRGARAVPGSAHVNVKVIDQVGSKSFGQAKLLLADAGAGVEQDDHIATACSHTASRAMVMTVQAGAKGD
jgi:hypothetical protein